MVRMVANYTNQKVYMQITLNKRLTVMADSGIRSDVASKIGSLTESQCWFIVRLQR